MRLTHPDRPKTAVESSPDYILQSFLSKVLHPLKDS
jgi:hypothetical protein